MVISSGRDRGPHKSRWITMCVATLVLDTCEENGGQAANLSEASHEDLRGSWGSVRRWIELRRRQQIWSFLAVVGRRKHSPLGESLDPWCRQKGDVVGTLWRVPQWRRRARWGRRVPLRSHAQHLFRDHCWLKPQGLDFRVTSRL